MFIPTTIMQIAHTASIKWFVAKLAASFHVGAILLTLTLVACQTPPQPCDCSVAEKELRAYSLKYADALEDIGNLRTELKICQGRH
jgi:hypothetical protein